MSYKYLASPYSHPDAGIRQARFEEAERATAWLLYNKIWVYSPIVHCHQLALGNSLPTNYEFWHDYNSTMIEASDGIIIFEMDGWTTSRGMKAEIDLAQKLGKDCYSLATSMVMRTVDPQEILSSFLSS